eukprot:4375973-Ditylum_brightwellii.AAC.1
MNAGSGAAAIADAFGVRYGDQAYAIYTKAGVDLKNTQCMALQPAQRVVQNEAPSTEEEKEEKKRRKKKQRTLHHSLQLCPSALSIFMSCGINTNLELVDKNLQKVSLLVNK